MQELLKKLRPVTDEDKGNLITVSYSKLDLVTNCHRRYKLRYVDKKYADKQTLPLELGSILHKGLELKGQALMKNEPVDYEKINNIVHEGSSEETEKDSEFMAGIDEISARYFEDWGAKDSVSGMTYNDKMDLYFNKVLPTRMEDEDWKVIGTEIPFEFVYDEKCIIHGFIDRLDKREVNDVEEYRITDYKSSKKIFDDSKIKTPLQMVIYDLACLFMYQVVPQYHEYDFILLDKKQTSEDGVCSKGYLKRGIKKLDNLLRVIKRMENEGEYAPSPTPLCYWCPYASRMHTPNADDKYGGNCDYYSLWRPDNKVFQVNKPYVPGEEEKPKRKLVF